jgi:signal transduction histidine kinase
MKPVSVTRSAITSALTGTTIVTIVLLLAILASARGPGLWALYIQMGSPPVELKVPGLAAVLTACALVLLPTFAVFFLIGRRAARPIELARQQQLQFTADASHELRTPLTVIEGEASLALGRQRRAAEYRLALEKVAAESTRMRRLVDDLLWLARSEADPDRPGFVAVDLSELARTAVGRFQGVAADKGLRLSLTIGDGPCPVVRAPVEWMERLLAVLVDNACRYTPAGGEIRVDARAIDDRVSLTVEDSGPGIPEAETDHIFDRFHRATQLSGGSGLGLAIASQVVTRTGGAWKVGRSHLGGALMAVSWRHREPLAARRSHAFRESSESDS